MAKNPNKTSNQEYWASVSSEEIADNILDKVDMYYQNLTQSGRLALYRKSWSYYYRPRLTSGQLNSMGEQSELTSMSVNQYRNLLLHLEMMTTQNRASFEPRATNSDVKSLAQTILAQGLLDYYMREKKLERNIKQSVKESLIFGEGFVRAEWDATSGEAYGMTETGATVYQGDIKYSNYTPVNVIRDITKTQSTDKDWVILRDFQNKFDLAAKFPNLGDEILNDCADINDIVRTTTVNALHLQDSDNIPVYTLLHPVTPAMPQGRFTTILDNGTVMQDGPIPYGNTHVYRIAPDEESGTIFGFTVGYDLLAIQEALDILYSTVITNQQTFGVQNILVPKGHDITTSSMSGGLNVIEYDPQIGKPESLNLTQTPPEIFNFMRMLEGVGETLSGVNSVARGNPEANLKSGAALAMVQSMAIQFSMGLQQSYSQLVEDLGTGTIKMLQTFASVPRVAIISGKSNRPLMREFTSDDLSGIQRVTVDMGNPTLRTTAGRVNMADAFMERGLIENPDQYLQVVNTGKLEPVIEGKQAALMLMRGENEQLSEGIAQRVLVTDNHAKHILEHSVVLSNPEIRQDPNNQIVQVTLAHIQEHITMLNDPTIQQLSAVLHQEAAPMAPMANPSAPMPLPAPNASSVPGVNMPSMPNPPANADAVSADIIKGF